MSDTVNYDSIEAILEFAIDKEREAQRFYREWAKKTKSPAIGQVLSGFADEESRHERYLSDVRSGAKMKPLSSEVTNLRISDYLVKVSPSEDMDYQKALMVAMQREKSSFRLYTGMAEKVSDTDVKNIFLQLAQEEAKHKLRLETIYDDEILAEN